MGRPAFEPTDEQRQSVEQWIQVPVSIEEMARRVGCTSKTFRKAFAAELGKNSVETERAPKAPPFQATDDQKRAVLIMAAAHGPEEEIACALGITVDLLQQHFVRELRDGPSIGYREGVESLFNQMKAGNTAATKAWLILNMQGDRMARTKVIPAPEQPAANGLKGKKQQADEAARGVVAGGGLFAPPTAPKLVVNNDQ